MTTTKKIVETYIKCHSKFTEKVTTENLLSLGIASISVMNEVLNIKNPIEPRMIIKYIGGTKEIIDGYENINKKLNELLEEL
jgi:hypothetical protein